MNKYKIKYQAFNGMIYTVEVEAINEQEAKESLGRVKKIFWCEHIKLY